MRDRLLNARKGFSLVEVMIAMGVVAVGLIAIIGLIPQGIQASRSAADNTLAATIVHDTFNQMRLLAFTTTTWPPSWPATLYPDSYYDAAGTNQVLGTSIDRYYRVRLLSQPSPSVPNLLVITAVVSWPAKSLSPLNNITNVTQIANYQQ